MSLILRQVVGYQQGRKAVSLTTTNPELEQQLKATKKELSAKQNQLKSILNKWKFGAETLTTAEQFLHHFEPWIEGQLEAQKELKGFLTKYSVADLEELAEYMANLPTETSNPELAHFLEFWGATSLAQVKETWQNTENDYLAQIQTLKDMEMRQNREVLPGVEELEREVQNLTTERDEAIREKQTTEQEVLALHNRLQNKNQEVNKKLAEIERLKKEKSQVEIALNKTITELREKHRKREKLLDEEQCENNKLTEKIEQLEAKIQELTK